MLFIVCVFVLFLFFFIMKLRTNVSIAKTVVMIVHNHMFSFMKCRESCRVIFCYSSILYITSLTMSSSLMVCSLVRCK